MVSEVGEAIALHRNGFGLGLVEQVCPIKAIFGKANLEAWRGGPAGSALEPGPHGSDPNARQSVAANSRC